MPDRSLRLTPALASAHGPTHDGRRGSTPGPGAVLLREGRPGPSSPAPEDQRGGRGSGGQGSGGQGSGGQGSAQDDNPFAPPPEGTPEQPWRPRHPNGSGSDDQGSGGQGDSPWGSQWSDQQPGRGSGGFGDRPRGQGQDGPGGQNGQGGGLRWDPTDPAQRRARYALLSGMWAFFFALFGWDYVALLLGALGMYWAVSALRAKPRRPDPTAAAAPEPAAARGSRPQTTAAISGLVTASLALVMVLATFGAQLIYRDYYTCRDDALTGASQQACEDLLPKQLRPLLTDRD
ncbi:hypothetical protein [Streptomyces spectabilis]|uniref:Integral membrane protein n=1 Tax=Streptomyces spectabilis TaxID=68270 RepID=A0A5P2XEF8_STRST|nr:hypothetical protein [Streptomyces spectabilis]MBB5109522.1 hypothetical protein [Streptomyces spectabilis]MCI3904609.1 hypothetical protein [Streptomyces spectabilis]QEV61689.1 hypothetical protein CP982_25735 [Streptomyces spectabilis]GGV28326.1 hypothetical protein GCM10010245_46440 [Streptomyces spectabilis]